MVSQGMTVGSRVKDVMDREVVSIDLAGTVAEAVDFDSLEGLVSAGDNAGPSPRSRYWERRPP
jgi:hypothetical protein